MATDVEDYRKQFNKLAEGSLVIFISHVARNRVINHLCATTEINEEIIATAYEFVNGDSNFVSFNRFIQTIKLILSIESGSKSLEQDLESNREFTYLEYTFIPDSQFCQLQFPLKLYEIKVPKTTDCEYLRLKLRERHDISEEDNLYITDNWRFTIHRTYKDFDNIADISRVNDDIFVYHKRKMQIEESPNAQFMKLLTYEDAVKYSTYLSIDYEAIYPIKSIKMDPKEFFNFNG